MPRLRMLVAGLAAAALLAPPPAAQASAAATLFNEINRARAARGLPLLRLASDLNRSAAVYARRLLASGRFSHSSAFLSGGFRNEVLALHFKRRLDPRLIFKGWMRSSGHRVVLLDRRFRYIGIGFATGRFRRSPAAMWVGRVAA